MSHLVQCPRCLGTNTSSQFRDLGLSALCHGCGHVWHMKTAMSSLAERVSAMRKPIVLTTPNANGDPDNPRKFR
jgi:hypothetical protein